MDGFATTYPAAAMNHTPDLLNHPALRPYKDSICATARPCAEITLLPAANLTLWQSKLGGQPYWPKDMEYPRNAKGRPLHLLAQINFAETPPLPDFPEEGILQFFIVPNPEIPDMWGMNLDDPARPDGFRVIYHPAPLLEAAGLNHDFGFLNDQPKPESKSWFRRLFAPSEIQFQMPFTSPCAMRFDLQQKFASLDEPGLGFTGQGVPEVNENFLQDASRAASLKDFHDIFNKTLEWDGHRLGGYGNCIQYDERRNGYCDYVLLLQIDGDDKNGVIWGDCGACHFYIHPRDLRQRDFSRVLYEWQCY